MLEDADALEMFEKKALMILVYISHPKRTRFLAILF